MKKVYILILLMMTVQISAHCGTCSVSTDKEMKKTGKSSCCVSNTDHHHSKAQKKSCCMDKDDHHKKKSMQQGKTSSCCVDTSAKLSTESHHKDKKSCCVEKSPAKSSCCVGKSALDIAPKSLKLPENLNQDDQKVQTVLKAYRKKMKAVNAKYERKLQRLAKDKN